MGKFQRNYMISTVYKAFDITNPNRYVALKKINDSKELHGVIRSILRF